MELVDTKLGRTIPLDFVIDADDTDDRLRGRDGRSLRGPVCRSVCRGRGGRPARTSYWFNGYRLTQIETIHDYLESLPEVGKVLSLATGMKVIKQLNDGLMPDD